MEADEGEARSGERMEGEDIASPLPASPGYASPMQQSPDQSDYVDSQTRSTAESPNTPSQSEGFASESNLSPREEAMESENPDENLQTDQSRSFSDNEADRPDAGSDFDNSLSESVPTQEREDEEDKSEEEDNGRCSPSEYTEASQHSATPSVSNTGEDSSQISTENIYADSVDEEDDYEERRSIGAYQSGADQDSRSQTSMSQLEQEENIESQDSTNNLNNSKQAPFKSVNDFKYEHASSLQGMEDVDSQDSDIKILRSTPQSPVCVSSSSGPGGEISTGTKDLEEMENMQESACNVSQGVAEGKIDHQNIDNAEDVCSRDSLDLTVDNDNEVKNKTSTTHDISSQLKSPDFHSGNVDTLSSGSPRSGEENESATWDLKPDAEVTDGGRRECVSEIDNKSKAAEMEAQLSNSPKMDVNDTEKQDEEEEEEGEEAVSSKSSDSEEEVSGDRSSDSGEEDEESGEEEEEVRRIEDGAEDISEEEESEVEREEEAAEKVSSSKTAISDPGHRPADKRGLGEDLTSKSRDVLAAETVQSKPSRDKIKTFVENREKERLERVRRRKERHEQQRLEELREKMEAKGSKKPFPVTERSSPGHELKSQTSLNEEHVELDYMEDVEGHDEGKDKLDDSREEEEGALKGNSESDDGELEDDDDCEEGEIREPGSRKPFVKPTCRFYLRGHCTWGGNCRFLHPGVNDKGNYQLIERPGFNNGRRGPPGFGPEEPFAEEPRSPSPEPPPPPSAPKEESAWERGLRHAKELMKKANERKVCEPNFEEKKMNLSIEENPEYNKENNIEKERVIVLRERSVV